MGGRWIAVIGACALVACAGAEKEVESGHGHGHAYAYGETGIARVTAIHGGAGPWVVAGYRMGEYALRTLGLPRGSFDVEVTHASPAEVQYSCIADGAAAATGASLGKLNLHWLEAARAETRTTYVRRSTGQKVVLGITAAFAARFADVPRPQLAAAGEEVLGLKDEEIFEVVGQ